MTTDPAFKDSIDFEYYRRLIERQRPCRICGVHVTREYYEWFTREVRKHKAQYGEALAEGIKAKPPLDWLKRKTQTD